MQNDFTVPHTPEGYASSWAQYTVQADNRDQVMAEYKARGVPTVIYYGTCMHQQTAFQDLGYSEGDFPVSELLASTVFSLPMHPYLDDSEVDNIVRRSDNC